MNRNMEYPVLKGKGEKIQVSGHTEKIEARWVVLLKARP